MIKTHLDSGVLIRAARGSDNITLTAMGILDDDQSPFVRVYL